MQHDFFFAVNLVKGLTRLTDIEVININYQKLSINYKNNS